jgi:4'-phosphopantetheinyl transferase
MNTAGFETGKPVIDIWLTYYGEIVDERQIAELRALLNAEEMRKESSFFFADDRKRYLVTRAMVRMLLSRYAPVAPAQWEFSKNAYGRPGIANELDEARDLVFNISHTRGLIVLAVTRGRELGVDVENIVARRAPIDIAERFFSATEVVGLSCIPAERQQERFFEYWTFKESYIKARGMGLSLPLDRFSFDFPHHRAVRISIQPDLDDHAERWSFWQCRPTSEYVMAICAERGAGASPTIAMRKFNPLVSEAQLAPEFLKTSDFHPA